MITCSALMLILVLYLPKFVKRDYNLIYHNQICPPPFLDVRTKISWYISEISLIGRCQQETWNANIDHLNFRIFYLFFVNLWTVFWYFMDMSTLSPKNRYHVSTLLMLKFLALKAWPWYMWAVVVLLRKELSMIEPNATHFFLGYFLLK